MKDFYDQLRAGDTDSRMSLAARFQFPQWLLAAMKFSGMWEEDFVDQVQVLRMFCKGLSVLCSGTLVNSCTVCWKRWWLIIMNGPTTVPVGLRCGTTMRLQHTSTRFGAFATWAPNHKTKRLVYLFVNGIVVCQPGAW